MDYPKSVPSVGLVNGKFVDENAVNGTSGSLIPAVWGNSVTQELLGVIKASGLSPDEADLTQLVKAIGLLRQSNASTYALDTGVANAYVAAYSPPIPALIDGLVVSFKAKATNTGASTFNPNGLGAKPIVGGALSALQGGELVMNGDVLLQYNISLGVGSWVVLASAGGGVQVSAATKSQHAARFAQIGGMNGVSVISASTILDSSYIGGLLIVYGEGLTQTLPAGASLWRGASITISAMRSCTIKANAAEVFASSAGVISSSIVIEEGEQRTLTTDGGTWYVSASSQNIATKVQAQTYSAFTATFVSPSMVVNPIPALTAYAANQRFRIKFGTNSGGGTNTLNVSGLGPKGLKQYSANGAKVEAFFVAGQLADVEYDGVDFVLLNPLVASADVPGTVKTFAFSSAPSGWLKANGAAVSRSAYSGLFSAIGTVFGAGDGSTTFNVPDLRGEFVRGWDDGRGKDLGRVFGSAQLDQFQSHRHSPFAGASAYTVYAPGGGGAAAGSGLSSATTTGEPSEGVGGVPRHGSETRPSNIALLQCIKF